MGNRFEGFNPKYNRFSEAYDNNINYKEIRERRVLSPKFEKMGDIRE